MIIDPSSSLYYKNLLFFLYASSLKCQFTLVAHANIYSNLIDSYLHKTTNNPAPANGSNNSRSDSPPGAPVVNDIARRLLVLANFYLNAHDEPPLDVVELGQLHRLLSSYYNTSDYSVHDILRELSPDCGDLVPRGIVYGAPVNTTQLFLKRATASSVCCIFNYRRPSYSRYP